MASTRRLEIVQDSTFPTATSEMRTYAYDQIGADTSDENAHYSHPLTNDIFLHPPPPRQCERSPLKPLRQARASSSSIVLGSKLNVPPLPPRPSIFTTDSPIKRPFDSVPYPIAAQKPRARIGTLFNHLSEKENCKSTYHNDNFAEFPDPLLTYSKPPKRVIANPDNPTGRPTKNVCIQDPEIPDPENMPSLEDDGRKPHYSYAMLIGMAILRAPGHRLTLAHIYKWISDSFSFYRQAGENGWQNSIRHNLSLNKAFIKQERPKDDPGKGNYWAIEPGKEGQFFKDKSSRRPTSSSGPSTKSSSFFLSSDAVTWSSQPPPPSKPVSYAAAIPRVSEAFELSSDATIPASDAPSQENDDEDTNTMPPPASRLPVSSPPQAIHSSPPNTSHALLQVDSPSPEIMPSGHVRTRKRRSAVMDDSGYFSSLDSSATRPLANPVLPDLHDDRPRIKRGRAEEEIARIRSSSHDLSPSKGRSLMTQPTASLVSSSPVRQLDNSLMLPPLTPAVKFKMPPKPPASISPNTNLRLHRKKVKEMIGSPFKNSFLHCEGVSLSPAFHILEDSPYAYNDICEAGFTDFITDTCRDTPSISPVKRSIKYSRGNRTNKTDNVLANITGASLNSKVQPLFHQTPTNESPLKLKSSQPLPDFGDGLEDTGKYDIFGIDISDDGEPDDYSGLDILQGFQKIGGNHQPLAGPSRSPSVVHRGRGQFSRI